MAVMNSNEFIKKLKEIEAQPTVYYSVAGGDWAKWNGSRWNFDCVILIKAILWGWNGDKNASHGGAKYASNGVYDDNADQIVNRCSNVSTDFTRLAPGELLWMPGHVGVYIGNGQVIECTAAWEAKVLYSRIDGAGRRTRNGRQVGSWKKHGKLNYIDYVTAPDFEPESSDKSVDIFYRVRTQKHGWLGEVKNYDDSDPVNGYAGWEDSPITDVAIRVSRGSVKYRVHVKGGGWLGWITQCNLDDFMYGYAGNGKPIDAIQIYYYTPDDIRPYKKAKYKVNNYGWQHDTDTNNGQDGYAGVMGVVVTKLRATIE